MVHRLWVSTAIILGQLIFVDYMYAAGDIKKARALVSTVYKRLASQNPSSEQLESWAKSYVGAKDAAAEKKVLSTVAAEAVKVDSFYSRTVLNYAERETNESGDITNVLNDHTATIVGMVRDGVDFRQVLYGDIIYVPNASLNLGNYSDGDNAVYESLQTQVQSGAMPLASSLQKATQSQTTAISVSSGVLTTRGYGSVFYNDGTNRSPILYTFRDYLCTDLETEVADATRPDIHVRRDVERAPGGDSQKFRSECVGCHAGLDPMSKAFAYIDWDAENSQLVYGSQPVPKVNRNSDAFPNGAVVKDNKWINFWTQGRNKSLGWNPKMTSGTGIKSWGQSIATHGKFPTCMAERVYKTVCFKESLSAREEGLVDSLSNSFKKSGYNMKELFKSSAVECASGLRF